MEHYTIKLPRGILNICKKRRLKKQLRKKLQEYIVRLLSRSEYRYRQQDAYYKFSVLRELLKKNRADTFLLAKEMRKYTSPQFDEKLFENACNVVACYAQNAQGILSGGTGLPK